MDDQLLRLECLKLARGDDADALVADAKKFLAFLNADEDKQEPEKTRNQLIAELWLAGVSARIIGEKVGVSVATVGVVRTKLGLPPRRAQPAGTIAGIKRANAARSARRQAAEIDDKIN